MFGPLLDMVLQELNVDTSQSDTLTAELRRRDNLIAIMLNAPEEERRLYFNELADKILISKGFALQEIDSSNVLEGAALQEIDDNVVLQELNEEPKRRKKRVVVTRDVSAAYTTVQSQSDTLIAELRRGDKIAIMLNAPEEKRRLYFNELADKILIALQEIDSSNVLEGAALQEIDSRNVLEGAALQEIDSSNVMEGAVLKEIDSSNVMEGAALKEIDSSNVLEVSDVEG